MFLHRVQARAQPLLGTAALLASLLGAGGALAEDAARDQPPTTAAATPAAATSGPMTRALYLDRLMLAESGGRDDARNPRSTAVGPYQFITATFLSVMRRHFPAEVAGLTDIELLARRTDRATARRAADAYTNDCAAELAAARVGTTFANLRLAFLLGPSGAIRVLRAPSETPVVNLVRPAVAIANPFLTRLTAGGLLTRAARDIGVTPDGTALAMMTTIAPMPVPPGLAGRPAVAVHCDLDRPSCRRWLALAQRKLVRTVARSKAARAQ